MKIVGLITEYNPFHNGHVYHAKKARELAEADAAISVMSGNFVQRGLPAICDKYARSKMALEYVDAVFELPTYYATSSAERFADGAVRTLGLLGCDSIVYGCETMGDFKGLAQFLCDEPKEYKELLKRYLSEGMNFPAAREMAVSSISEDFGKLLHGPNNILAIEYEKAIIKNGLNISTYQILRNDEGYLESGESIRAALGALADIDRSESSASSCKELERFLPSTTIENICYTIDIEDFSQLLFFKLSELSKSDLASFYEMTEEIAARIKKYEGEAGGEVTKLAGLVSAKNITESAVRRALVHVLLDIKADDAQEIYARLLGFNNSSDVMQEIKKRASIQIVTKYADADDELIKIDGHASEVYNQVVKYSKGVSIPNEYHAGVTIVS